MEGAGFEPTKAEPSDLQSDPFGHLGIPPHLSPQAHRRADRLRAKDEPSAALLPAHKGARASPVQTGRLSGRCAQPES